MAAGATLTSSDIVARVGTASLTGDSAGYTTEVSIMSVTAFLEAGRRYAITGIVRVSINAGTFPAAETALARIREDSVSGNPIGLTQWPILTVSVTGYGNPPLYAEYTAGATGNKTFHLCAQRVNGSATHQVRAAPSAPAWLYVDLIRS